MTNYSPKDLKRLFTIMYKDTFVKIKSNSGNNIYGYSPSVYDVYLAREIAKLKSQETMNRNQNAQLRDSHTKLIKQFQGTLAELAVVKYLLFIGINFEDIKWFDLERKDFKYTKQEYDVKLDFNGNEIKIDVRSSFYKHEDIKTIFNDGIQMDFMPRYTNKYKSKEVLTDLSIRVIYHYNKKVQKNEDIDYDSRDYWNDIYNWDLQCFIVGAATKDMFEKSGVMKRMGQSNTEYVTIPINKGINIDDLKNTIDNLINNK